MTTPRARILAVAAILVAAMLGVPSGTAAGAAQERVSGNVRFLLISDGPGPGTVVANGAVHDHGTDRVLGPQRDRFSFSAGNIVLRHEPQHSREHYDPVSCHFSFVERGTWRAVQGTRAYHDVRGHGRYVARGQGVGCNQNQQPKVFVSLVRARGHLSY
jgi:hypothetical protein